MKKAPAVRRLNGCSCSSEARHKGKPGRYFDQRNPPAVAARPPSPHKKASQSSHSNERTADHNDGGETGASPKASSGAVMVVASV